MRKGKIFALALMLTLYTTTIVEARTYTLNKADLSRKLGTYGWYGTTSTLKSDIPYLGTCKFESKGTTTRHLVWT